VTLLAAQAAVTIERWGATRRSSTGFVGSSARRTHAGRPRGARRSPASRSRRPSPARADRRPEGARLRPRSIRRVSRCRDGRRGCRRPDRLRRLLRVQEHSRAGARKERAHRLGPRRSRGRPGQCAPSPRTGGTLIASSLTRRRSASFPPMTRTVPIPASLTMAFASRARPAAASRSPLTSQDAWRATRSSDSRRPGGRAQPDRASCTTRPAPRSAASSSTSQRSTVPRRS
jgi:hypothetical protein